MATAEKWRRLRQEAQQPFTPWRWWLQLLLACCCCCFRRLKQRDPEQAAIEAVQDAAKPRKPCAAAVLPAVSPTPECRKTLKPCNTPCSARRLGTRPPIRQATCFSVPLGLKDVPLATERSR